MVKVQQLLNQNAVIICEENVFENVICKLQPFSLDLYLLNFPSSALMVVSEE